MRRKTIALSRTAQDRKSAESMEQLSILMREMPSIEYMMRADEKALESFELSRVTYARNLERDMHAIDQERLKALREADLAMLIRRYRQELRERTKQVPWAKPALEGSEPDHE